ncbi:MAG: hypothetical protein KBC22_02805 [Candidatus Pacebacteria bacterium]|nr:hypothetical protein [Candidatus Paceibacterota bacterium]
MENNSVVKKGGYWALIAGILYIPMIFVTLGISVPLAMGYGAPGADEIWWTLPLVVWFAIIHPLMCVVASISGFVYHFKNKYGTGAKINKRLIIVPIVYFLILIVAISALMFFAFSTQDSHFLSL